MVLRVVQRQQTPRTTRRPTHQRIHAHTRTLRSDGRGGEGALRQHTLAMLQRHTLDLPTIALELQQRRHVHAQSTHAVQQRRQLAVRLPTTLAPRLLTLARFTTSRCDRTPQRQRHTLHLTHYRLRVVHTCRLGQRTPRDHIGTQSGLHGQEVCVCAERRQTRRVLRLTSPTHTHAVDPLVPRRRPPVVVHQHELATHRVHRRLQPLLHRVQRVQPLTLSTHNTPTSPTYHTRSFS